MWLLLATACAPTGGDDASSTGPGGGEGSDLEDICTLDTTCEGDLCWVRMCGGTYPMGDLHGIGEPDEQPVHDVEVPTFEILRTEVTVAQYAPCVEAGVCEPYADPDAPLSTSSWGVEGQDDFPMNGLTHAMASTFCEWAGGRLPSEAEWEYAARSGGMDRIYPWGDAEPDCDLAVLWRDGEGCDGSVRTQAVCSKPAGDTEQGLCDMAGNAFEWVLDRYHETYNGAPTNGLAWLTLSDTDLSYRVMRGGGVNSACDVRAANRTLHAEDFFYGGMGVRCARGVTR